MKFVPAVMLSTLAVVGTAVGATAANFAVLSDHGSLHGNTEFGGIAPAAEEHSVNGVQPTPSVTAPIIPSDDDDDTERNHSNHAGVPAPWVSHDEDDDEDMDDEDHPPVAVPTSNKPEVTLTPHPTKSTKPQKTEETHEEEHEEEEHEEEEDDD